MQTLSDGSAYTYDANGNMVTRHVQVSGAWQTYVQEFDAENRLIHVSMSDQTLQFTYNGDGNLARKRTQRGTEVTTTLYIGPYLEVLLPATPPSPTPTPTPTPSPTPTATPTPTPSPTSTATPTPTPTRTPKPTFTPWPRPTVDPFRPDLSYGGLAPAGGAATMASTSAPPVGQLWRAYYYAGGQRLAVRERTATTDVLTYLRPSPLRAGSDHP